MVKFSTLLLAVFLLHFFSSPQSHAQSLVWAKNYGGGKKDKGRDIGVDADGNSYVVGFFTNKITFGNTTLYTSSDSIDEDIFIVKLDINGDPLWAHSMGNGIDNHTDFPFGFSVNSEGYSVITGNCQNYMLADDGTYVPGIGDDDMFLALYDPQGNLQWLKLGGGTGIDMGTGVYLDDNNMIYATGNAVGDFNIFGDFDYVDTSLAHHVYIAQYNLNGDLQWNKIYTSQTNFESRDITADNSGGLYIGGNFSNSVSFDNANLASAGADDGWLLKLGTNNGVFQWAKNFGSSDVDSYESAYSLTTDVSDNLYVTTVFKNDIQFDGNYTTTNLENNIAVASFDANGIYKWCNVVKGGVNSNFSVFCLGLLAEDNLILTGCFAGEDTIGLTENIPIEPYSNTLYADAFYAAFDPNTGMAQWGLNVGGQSSDAGYGLAGNHTGYGYASGNFRYEGTFGPFTLTSNGVSDAYVIKFHESNPTGISNSAADVITAFPNPTTEEIELLVPYGVTNVKLTNALGQIVMNEPITGGGLRTLNLQSMSSGVYFVHLEGNNVSYSCKVVRD